MLNALEKFIAIKTIANNDEGNSNGIQYVTELLSTLNFKVTLEGDSPTNQPVLVAKYTNSNTDKKVVLYAHYDVEKIKGWEKWDTPPFKVVEKSGRYFCRGIADNKGILLCRLFAIQEMVNAGEELPNILWIIQGEEEVAGPTPFKIIPRLLNEFQATIHVEETGVYKKDNTPVIFHLPKTDKRPAFLKDLNEHIYGGEAIYENRQLNKFTPCPFTTNLPEYGIYIGFGPNDGQCRIHQDNESLDVDKLNNHKDVFKKFIRWINKTTI